LPRFSEANREANQRLVDALAALARERNVTPAQLAIAWVRAKSPSFVPVMGARTRTQLEESLGALAIALTPAEVASIEAAIPAGSVAGTRYAPAQMAHLDSERPA
jgi:aryl-alcohol dehydrogenase-like predicted oxidoreductase